MKIARVFPRKTSMSPTDELAFFGPPGLFPPEVDEVHVSVTWDADIPIAEKLVKTWSRVAPAKIGGPALGPGGEFTPGMYLKDGITVTSRGCKNRCWFCRVWRVDGDIRELPITHGFNVIDDNLLACSDGHVNAVFDMLRDHGIPAIFSGGLDVKLVTKKTCELLNNIKIKQVYFALDTDNDFEPFCQAISLIKTNTELKRWHLFSYVLIGYVGDTFDTAKERLDFVASCGVTPKAMLWNENQDIEWKRFQREYYRDILLWQKYHDYWKAA